MKKITFLLVLAATCVLAVSCQKGETGERGASGERGAQGPQGSQGNTGTANVIYSDWLFVGTSEWKDTSLTNIPRCQRFVKSASAITQQVLDSGVVLAYLRDTVVNVIYPLPFTYNVNPPRIHAFIPQLSKILFYEYATDGTGGLTSSRNKYRYIVIPGGQRTGGRSRDWRNMPYKEVCQALQIPE